MLAAFPRFCLAVAATRMGIDRRGVTAIEYALIAALIAVAIVGAVSALGAHLSVSFSDVASEL
jgi:pilus assembly protein Flp/PilA